MSGLFGTLNIGVKGMTAAQTALQTTSHNVSNMNTPGYSRQRVNLQADNPYNYTGVGQLGTGVKMSGVVRVVDDYVTKQIQEETSSYSRHATKSDALSQLEMIFDEPSETGLSAGFSRVYAAWNYLGSSPELATAKTMVSQESQTLTDTIKQMANQIEGLEGDTLYSIEKDVLDFNEKVGQLSTLNKQIFNVVIKGQTPNDLLDQRDRLTTELASIADVTITYDKFQGVKLELDGNPVLEGDTINKLAINPNGPKGQVEIHTADGQF
ncbi:flagellar hook-associated protein FlgK, partial [Jeotgalibaca porci]|uniref:flagellar hook-associated protein FlgK n=1 Tax=Jeotgalibaca porci TaxID=1868793 RepID=UPI0035A0446D